MKDSSAAFAVKKAFVISDDDRLARAIALVLDSCLDIEKIELQQGLRRQGASPIEDEVLDLIVLALSSVDSEPLVFLARASLGAMIGRVPILIVSERVFSSDPGDNVFHADFPYAAHKLCEQVRKILWGNLWSPQAVGAPSSSSFMRAYTKLLPQVQSGSL